MQGKSTCPALSVIVAVYNTRNYLPTCFDSLIGQTLGDIEIICIDDGSTDGSSEILARYADADSRIRVFTRMHGGVSAARNYALDNARGEFVLFVDSDDYLALDSCELLVEAARADSADIVVFGGRTFPPMKWFDERCFAVTETAMTDPFDALFEGVGSYPLIGNKMYRRTLLDEHGCRFDEDLVLGEDNAFQFQVFPHARKVLFCPIDAYRYRCMREGSSADRFDEARGRLEQHLQVVGRIVREWSERGYIDSQGARLLSWICTFLVSDARTLPLLERHAFSDRFSTIYQGARLDRYRSELDSFHEDRLRFLLNELSSDDGPLVTVVCLSQQPGERGTGLLDSLAAQSDPRFELLISSSLVEASAIVRRFMENDVRVRILDASFHDGVQGVCGEAQGRYIAFADLDDEFVDDFIEVIAGKLPAGSVDVATAPHPFRGGYGVWRNGGIAQHLAYGTLSPKDKLFSTEFLRAQDAVSLDECGIGLLLLSGETVLFLEKGMIGKYAAKRTSSDAARRVAQESAESLRQLRAIIEGADLGDECERALFCSALHTLLADFAVEERAEAIEPLFAEMRNIVFQILPPVRADIPWFESGDDMDCLAALDAGNAFDLSMLLARKRAAALEAECLDNRGQVERHRERLDAYERSTSLRVGRAVTGIPRGIRSLLKKKVPVLSDLALAHS